MEFSVLSHPTSLFFERKGGKTCGNHDIVKSLESGNLDSSGRTLLPFFSVTQDPSGNLSLCKFKRPDAVFPASFAARIWACGLSSTDGQFDMSTY